MKKILFFGIILDVGLEAYMELYVYGYISITSKISILSGDIIGLIVGYFSMFIAMIFIPFSLIRVVFFTYKHMFEEYFYKEMWGTLYEEIRKHKRIQIAYNLFYILLFTVNLLSW